MARSRRGMVLTAATACALALLPGAATAATITVTTTADEAGDAGGDCSLREAVRAADENSNAHEAGCTAGDGGATLDTIQLAAATYPLTLAGANEEANLTGDLDLRTGGAGPAAIVGAGAGATVIDAGALGDRVLETRVSTTLDGLSITGASPPDNNDGGAVFADGSSMGNALDLDLEDVALQGNFANGAGGDGGAVQISGGNFDDSLTITDSVLSGNDAGRHGGAVDAFSVDDVTVMGSVLSGNTAGSEAAGVGGAMRLEANAAPDNTIEVVDSSITGGEADGGGGLHIANAGGAVDITRAVIAGNDSVSGQDGGGLRVAGGDTTFTDSVVRNNSATGGGVPLGGGIMATAGGSLALVRTTVSANHSDFNGGGIHAVVNELDAYNTTISGNSADTGTAIDLEDTVPSSTASLVHATVSGNTANGPASPAIRLTSGGGPLSLNLRESVIDQTETSTCSATGGASLVSFGFNVDRRFFCSDPGAPDTQNTDPQLRPLGDYGGTRAGAPGVLEALPLHALAVDSTAVDEVPLAGCTDDGTAAGTQDQRGFPRPFPAGGACDSGAYEVVEPCQGLGSTILGTANAETINGSGGADVISALDGGDFVNGVGGDDAICTGGGNDMVNGGEGDDALDGGAGIDTVTYSGGATIFTGGAAVNADLGGGFATGQGADSLDGFEVLVGSVLNDRLAGDGQSNTIIGLDGNDELRLGAGNDVGSGGGGSDRVFGEAGRDLLRGELGNDRLFGGGGAGDRLFGGAGKDGHNGGGGKKDYCHGGGNKDRPKTKGCEKVRKIP